MFKHKEKNKLQRMNIFSDAPIWKSLLIMAIPSLVLMLVMGMYFFSDSVLSINLASDSYTSDFLSAEDKVRIYMGGYAPINSLMIAIALLFGMGISTRVSINLGAKNKERALNTIKTGLMVGLAISLILVPILLVTAKTWIKSQYSPTIAQQVSNESFKYAWIIIMAFPLFMFNSIIPSLFRTEARNKEMMIALILPIGVNLLLDWMMMGPIGMGVEGGAWATFIADIFTSLLLIIFIYSNKKSFIRFKNMFGLKFRIISIIGIILVGIAPFLRNMSQSITSTVNMQVIKDVSGHVYQNTAGDFYQTEQLQNAFTAGLLMQDIGVANSIGFQESGDWISLTNHEQFLQLHSFIENNWSSLLSNSQVQNIINSQIKPGLEENIMTLIGTGVMPIFMLFFPLMFAFAQAARPIASFNFGAKKYNRVRQTYWWTILYATIASIGIYFLTSWVLASPLLDILRVSGQVKERSIIVLRIIMISMMAFPFAIGAIVIFGSTDRLIQSIIASTLQGLILFFPAIFIFKYLAIHSSYEYIFWFYLVISSGAASLISTCMALFTLKRINNPQQLTLDDRLNKIYKWIKSKKFKKEKAPLN